MITLETKRISQVLDINAKCLGASKIIPMYESILFNIKGGKCNIVTSDGTSEITTFMKVDDESINESFAVEGKVFMDTIKLIDQPEITLELKEKTLIVKAGKSKYKMSVYPSKDFPIMPYDETIESVKIPNDTADKMIKSGVCVDGNGIRTSMSGINIYSEKGKLIIQGTDSFNFYRSTVDFDGDNIESVVINKNIVAIVDTFKNTNDLHFSTNKKIALFKDGSATVKVNLVDIAPPNSGYPNKSANELISRVGKGGYFTINRIALIKSIKRAMIYSNTETRGVVFSCSEEDKDVLIYSSSKVLNRESNEPLEVKSFQIGKDLKVGFDSRRLLTALNLIESDLVKIQLTGPREFMVISNNEGDSSEISIVMPQHISEG